MTGSGSPGAAANKGLELTKSKMTGKQGFAAQSRVGQTSETRRLR